MKLHLLIRPNVYPLTFRVFFNYKNKDKAELIRHIRTRSTETRKAIIDAVNEHNLCDVDGLHINHGSHFIIIMPNFQTNNFKHYSYLQHELTHAVLVSGNYMGFGIGKDSEEYYCYMMGFLTERIYKELW